MWMKFFEAGGWGMYPTTVFGFLLVATGVLYVLRPERRFVDVVVVSGLLTVLSGVLGCSVGLATTFQFVRTVEPVEQLAVTLAGAAESLNNVILALILCLVTGVVVLGGVARGALRAGRGT